MKEQGIEEIFKTAFDKFEADVDPNVWTNVQQAINVPATAHSGHEANSSHIHAGKFAGKAGAFAGKLGVKAIIAIVTTVTGVSVGSYFLLSDRSSQKTTSPQAQQTEFNPAIERQQHTTVEAQTPVKTSTVPDAEITEKPAAANPVKAQSKKVEASQDKTHPQQTLTANASVPAKSGATNATVYSNPASAKSHPSTSNTLPSNSQDNAKSTEADNAAVTHTYQNDFADINNYLEPEGASGTAALPNIFSPNGDGKNDVFTIKTKNLKTLAVTVFNQSGKLIYQWNGLDGGWDGNLSDGHPAPVGNYFYSLLAETTDGRRCIANSPLTLRR